MLREEIRFTDYNDQPSVTVEYFNLSKNEILDLEGNIEGGLSAKIRAIEDNPTAKGVLDLLKILAHAAYGHKSQDGKFFEKSEEITRRFISSAFYDDFLFSLVENDAQKGLQFIRGILPAQLLEQAERQIQSNQIAQPDTRTFAPSAREQFAASQVPAGTVDVNTTHQPQPFGQPNYPHIAQAEPSLQVQENPPQQAYPGPQNSEELERFRQWEAQQAAAKATQTSAAPASPDAFRVREEDPMQGLPRPPHEQMGDSQ